jgi:hypothetical protein
MLFPKLTQYQMENLSKKAEACLVHPYNVRTLDSMTPEERFHFENDYEKIIHEFNELVTPQIVLSLIQTIALPNAQRSYDLGHDLTD